MQAFRNRLTSTILDQFNENFGDFKQFLDTLSEKQDTARFWRDFLFQDCFPYISLFTAVRYRNWEMRVGSIKQLVAIYAAFDRKTYEELLPRHLHDLAILPNYIIEHFQKGSFSIRLTKSDWCGVALDEMKINKDAKLAVIRPNKEKMQSIANYLPFRAKCINNF